MSNSSKLHWWLVKWILKYLRETANSTLCSKKSSKELKGYLSAALAGDGDIDERKSTTAYIYTLNSTTVS